MADNRSTLSIDTRRLGADELRKLNRDLKDTADSFDDVSDSAEDAGRSGTDAISKLKREVRDAEGSFQDLAIVSTTIAASLGLATKTTIDAAISFENLNASLVSVAGSQEAARKQLSDLLEVARQPGLGLEEAARGSINLQSVGVSAEFAAALLSEVGNSLARIGSGRQELEGVIVGVRQMASAGKVLQEELNQISSRILDVNKILIEAFGSARAEDLQRMGVTVDRFLRTLVTGLSGLERVGETTANTIENVSDTARQVQARFGQEFLPIVRGVLNAISDLGERFLVLDDSQVRLIAQLTATATALAGITAVGSTLALTLPTIVGGIKAFGAALVFLATNPITLAATAMAGLGALHVAYRKEIEKSIVATGMLERGLATQNREMIEKGLGPAFENLRQLVNRRNELVRELREAESRARGGGFFLNVQDAANDAKRLREEISRVTGDIQTIERLRRQGREALTAPEEELELSLPQGIQKQEQETTKAVKQEADRRKEFRQELFDFGIRLSEAETAENARALQIRFQRFVADNADRIREFRDTRELILAIQQGFSEQVAALESGERSSAVEEENSRRRIQNAERENNLKIGMAREFSRFGLDIADLEDARGAERLQKRIGRFSEENASRLAMFEGFADAMQKLESDLDDRLAQLREKEADEELRKEFERANERARIRIDSEGRALREQSRLRAEAEKADAAGAKAAELEALQFRFEGINRFHKDLMNLVSESNRRAAEGASRAARSVGDVFGNISTELFDGFIFRKRLTEEAERDLENLERDRLRRIQRVNEDETLSVGRKERRIQRIEQDSADRRLEIERNLAESRKSVFRDMVEDFLTQMARVALTEAAAALGRFATQQALTATGVAPGQASAATPVQENGEIFTSFGLLGIAAQQIFHDPRNDALLVSAGRLEGARLKAASDVLGRQQAADMTRSFQAGFRSQVQAQPAPPEPETIIVNVEIQPVMAGDQIRFQERKKTIMRRRGLIASEAEQI